MARVVSLGASAVIVLPDRVHADGCLVPCFVKNSECVLILKNKKREKQKTVEIGQPSESRYASHSSCISLPVVRVRVTARCGAYSFGWAAPSHVVSFCDSHSGY